MSWELYRVEQDPTYHRGLRWWYHVEVHVQALVEQMECQFPGLRVQVEHFWGPQPVVRMVWPFRFEVRFGECAGRLTFRHRACALPERQVEDRAAFEGALITTILGARGRASA